MIRVVCSLGSDRKQPCLQPSLFSTPYFVLLTPSVYSLSPPPPFSLLCPSLPSLLIHSYSIHKESAGGGCFWLMSREKWGRRWDFTLASETQTGLAVLEKQQRGACQTSDVVEEEENRVAFLVVHADLVTDCLEVLCPAVSRTLWRAWEGGSALAIQAKGMARTNFTKSSSDLHMHAVERITPTIELLLCTSRCTGCFLELSPHTTLYVSAVLGDLVGACLPHNTSSYPHLPLLVLEPLNICFQRLPLRIQATVRAWQLPPFLLDMTVTGFIELSYYKVTEYVWGTDFQGWGGGSVGKCLPRKHKGLSSIPRMYRRKPGVVTHAYWLSRLWRASLTR